MKSSKLYDSSKWWLARLQLFKRLHTAIEHVGYNKPMSIDVTLDSGKSVACKSCVSALVKLKGGLTDSSD